MEKEIEDHQLINMILRGKPKLNNLKMLKRQKNTVKDIIMKKIKFQNLNKFHKFHQIINSGLIWQPIQFKKGYFKNALSLLISFIIINHR